MRGHKIWLIDYNWRLVKIQRLVGLLSRVFQVVKERGLALDMSLLPFHIWSYLMNQQVVLIVQQLLESVNCLKKRLPMAWL